MNEDGSLQLPLDDPALSGFTIERELGGGGMSRLFVANDRQFDRRVVIKVLVPTDIRSMSADRFRREIAVATSLQHPNIVPIFSAGELGGDHAIPFLVMPYVEGESLRDRLLRGPLSIREAVYIARDVARALVYAHDRGIVHRDIKPGNVLLPAGAAVVSDFGVAKALTSSRQGGRVASGEHSGGRRVAHHSLTAIGTSLGTPAYMAPEQAAADPNVDHRADIYALGIVLYEMLAGTPPFHGRSPQELLRAQLADPPPPVAARRYDVPVRLAELIDRCLEKDPARRPRTATEVFRWLDDPAVVSGTFAVAAASAKRQRSRVVAQRGSIAVVVGALALAAFYFNTDWRGEVAAADSAAMVSNAPRWTRQLLIGPVIAIGGDQRSSTLIEGLTSEVANAAASVPGIHVGGQLISTVPAVPPADSGATAPGTSPLLGTTEILRIEGTVQRENSQFRVILRAVDMQTDSSLWSGAFDGHADSLLALQGRVSRGVASALTMISVARNAR